MRNMEREEMIEYFRTDSRLLIPSLNNSFSFWFWFFVPVFFFSFYLFCIVFMTKKLFLFLFSIHLFYQLAFPFFSQLHYILYFTPLPLFLSYFLFIIYRLLSNNQKKSSVKKLKIKFRIINNFFQKILLTRKYGKSL